MEKQTALESFTVSIQVKKTPLEAYRAILNFRAWWSEEIEGSTDVVNEEFIYHYRDIHICKMKLEEAIPGKRIVYRVIDNHFNFIRDQREWVDSQLVFEMENVGETTTIHFTHEGLLPTDECYSVCRDGWTEYITGSLFDLITSGKGKPNPSSGEGFNAELARRWKLS